MDDRRVQVNRFFVCQLMILCGFLASGAVIADGDVAAGQEKAASCGGCHGMEGEGFGENPPIAGLDRELLESGMLEYKTGERTEAMMAMLMQALSDEDIADLAAYYASLSSAP